MTGFGIFQAESIMAVDHIFHVHQKTLDGEMGVTRFISFHSYHLPL